MLHQVERNVLNALTRRKRNGSIPRGNPLPTRTLSLGEVECYRYLDCPEDPVCLGWAADNHWNAFTCEYCKLNPSPCPNFGRELGEGELELIGMLIKMKEEIEKREEREVEWIELGLGFADQIRDLPALEELLGVKIAVLPYPIYLLKFYLGGQYNE